MISMKDVLLGLAVCAVLVSQASAKASAQDDPFADEPAGDAPSDDAAPPAEAPAAAEPSEPAESEAPAEPEPASEATPADAAGGVSAEAGVSLSATTPGVDAVPSVATPAPSAQAPVVAGSRIRRARMMSESTPVIPSPLRTDLQGPEYLQTRKQLGGAAVPDTAAALGYGAAGTSRLDLRLQPTLILLNGRRLVSAPFFGPNGTDFVDMNQLPIQLIDHAEITSGLASALYGEGAIGGVANFVTRRNIDGVDVELGGQATDKFDQGEGDITLLLGTGEGKSGANLMLSYFNRLPLAASDRDWIGERVDRTESLISSPGSFQQLTNFDYPVGDPYCGIAQGAGHATGYEVRLRGYGPPSTLSAIEQINPELASRLLATSDGARGTPPPNGTMNNMVVDPFETATYCAGNFTGNNDLILRDERVQSYGTFWHKLSEHSEVFGEAGFYKTDNENRTAPSFPISRLAPSTFDGNLLLVPNTHPDQPVQAYGFMASTGSMGVVPNDLFVLSRTQGTFNGDGMHERSMDSLRAVLGVQGDLAGVAPTGIVSTWDWDLAGTYNVSHLTSRVQDTLMDKLLAALNSCPADKISQETLTRVPTTIADRQNAGCYNPFYSSVVNNAAIDPLNVSNRSAQASEAGFITSDTDDIEGFGYGTQDGGYICDPNDPNSPACPASFDRDGDGVFELAGQPNTQEVIDRITGEHIEFQERALASVGANLRGDIAQWSGGGLAFGVGTEYRRESLLIDYDQAYNERLYGFLFGGNDLDPVTRNVIAGNAELRVTVADGILEVQPAVRVELYDTVGAGVNVLGGLAVRPFAKSGDPALEYLGLRGHIGRGQQPPSLVQLYGQMNEFVQVDYHGGTQFIAHQLSGNPDLDFETYTTISAGPMYDWAGLHVGADFWHTMIDDMVAGDNARTLVNDCDAQFQAGVTPCTELVLLEDTEALDHLESRFDNIAQVTTNGVDGSIMYTLDSKRRGLGDFGTFVLGVQGTYINSYLIEGPRVLASYYRDGAPATVGERDPETARIRYDAPQFGMDGSRNYNQLHAEYEAAGYRNYENFAPPIPKLRFSIPVRWMILGHTVGATLRYVDGYYDDSEYTIEKQGLPGIDQIQFYDGEQIASWMALDALYSFAWGDKETWAGKVTIGALNLLDSAPPAVEGPLGYEVGVTDPRGRSLYVRVSGDF